MIYYCLSISPYNNASKYKRGQLYHLHLSTTDDDGLIVSVMIMMMTNTINHYNHHNLYNNDEELQTTMVIIAMPSLMVTMIKETSMVGTNNSTPIIQEQVTMT